MYKYCLMVHFVGKNTKRLIVACECVCRLTWKWAQEPSYADSRHEKRCKESTIILNLLRKLEWTFCYEWNKAGQMISYHQTLFTYMSHNVHNVCGSCWVWPDSPPVIKFHFVSLTLSIRRMWLNVTYLGWIMVLVGTLLCCPAPELLWCLNYLKV